MSWFINITANTDIKKKDINKIVAKLPQELKNNFAFISSKQDWGWSCATDIYKPKGKKLHVCGAGYSRHLSQKMVDYLKIELRRIGYKYVRSSKRYD